MSIIHSINLEGNISLSIYDPLAPALIQSCRQLQLFVEHGRIFKIYDCDDEEVILVSYILKETSTWKPVCEVITGSAHPIVLEKQFMGLISMINRFNHNEGLVAFLKLPNDQQLILMVPDLHFTVMLRNIFILSKYIVDRLIVMLINLRLPVNRLTMSQCRVILKKR